jgi:hypothetical protein
MAIDDAVFFDSSPGTPAKWYYMFIKCIYLNVANDICLYRSTDTMIK